MKFSVKVDEDWKLEDIRFKLADFFQGVLGFGNPRIAGQKKYIYPPLCFVLMVRLWAKS